MNYWNVNYKKFAICLYQIVELLVTMFSQNTICIRFITSEFDIAIIRLILHCELPNAAHNTHNART